MPLIKALRKEHLKEVLKSNRMLDLGCMGSRPGGCLQESRRFFNRVKAHEVIVVNGHSNDQTVVEILRLHKISINGITTYMITGDIAL